VEALFDMRLTAVVDRRDVESVSDAPTFELIAAQAPTLLAAARLLVHDVKSELKTGLQRLREILL
jgi:hypothetical protein